MKYFLWINGKQDGPYEPEQIREMIEKGSIAAVTLARREDSTGDWHPINSFPEVIHPPRQPNPPPPATPVLKTTRSILWKILIGVGVFAVLFIIIGFIGLKIWAKHELRTLTGNHQLIDKNVIPVSGAYGFNLGDKLPDSFEIRSNDEAFGLTYNLNIPEGDMIISGYLILTESKQIAGISIEDIGGTHFESVKTALREKYGLRETYQDFMGQHKYCFGTTNRQAILTDGSRFSLYELEYLDEDLVRIANTETENRKAAVKKKIEDDMKSHL